MTNTLQQDASSLVTRSQLEAVRDSIVRDLKLGRIPVPQSSRSQAVLAGGSNFFPDSDVSYSTRAATTAGVLPSEVFDDNYEAFGLFWAERGADVSIDAAHAIKSVGHSLYAAEEGTHTGEPDWDRVNGWIRDGAAGATQYDVIVVLPLGLVGPGQRWYFRFRAGALTPDVLPGDVQAAAGFWHETGAGQGFIEGGAFTLACEIKGTPGATSLDYRVLARTDGGVVILSNVLNVPDAPAVLSEIDYVKLFFSPGPGFIEFQIYKKVGGIFHHLFTIRNSSDLQYNDTGIDVFGVVAGWPSVAQAAPQAFAQSGGARDLQVGAYQSEWKPNDLTIQVPPTYDYTQTTALYFRIFLTAATAADRQVGLDRFVLSTTYHEWAPDPPIKFADGTTAIPSVSPTSGMQGAGGGVTDPPDPGSGGRTCVLVNTPVLTEGERRRRGFKQYQSVRVGSLVRGEERQPYFVLDKRQGMVSEYVLIRTANGITLQCTADHELALSVSPRRRIRADLVEVGTRLACEVRGRKTHTTVTKKKLVPRAAAVGTFTLAHTGGSHRDGDGMFLAGRSERMDRALFCFNTKVQESQ